MEMSCLLLFIVLMSGMGAHAGIQRSRMRSRKHGLMENVPTSSFLATVFTFNTQDDPAML